MDPAVGAWAQFDPDIARSSAHDVDKLDLSKIRPEPILAGTPIGVKDCFNTTDFPTAMGSDLWQDFTPGNDARTVGLAKLLGAIVVGKTVTAEFATHEAGFTLNPHNQDRLAGTSSTGSAVAVACGMVPVALGTQTAGSIIRPASYCGVVGFKPSFGLIPRTGILKTADTLDTVGWLSRSVADVRLLLQALSVRGHNYPMADRGQARAAAKTDFSKPLRLLLAYPPTWDDADDQVRDQLVDYARQIGNRPDIVVEEADLRDTFADAHSILRTIYNKQLSYYFQRELQTPFRISDAFRDVTDAGMKVTREEYLAALQRQREMGRALDDTLANHDAMITLSVAGEAPRLTAGPERDDSSWIWTLCGGPSISLPLLSGPNGMPIGAQLVAPKYGDITLLEIAERLYPGAAPIITPEPKRVSA